MKRMLLCALACLPVMWAQATAAPVKVSNEVHHDTLPSLRDTQPQPDGYQRRHEHDEHRLPLPYQPPGQVDGALQTFLPRAPLAATLLDSRDGLGTGFSGPNGNFVVDSAPPDTVGAIGTTQYVQVVNEGIAVFDKVTGAVTYGPVPTNTLWSGFGGQCETDNDGDAIVVFDHIANRWVISQFGVGKTPYLQCVAVSQTADATGAWNRYSFSYGSVFPDYPKMGVWPDAYYETFNMFNGNSFVGSDLCAYDRTAMLAGAAATQQCFQLASSFGGVLPSDLDGSALPPAGAPNYHLNFDTNSLNLWAFHVDWATPANTTLTGPTNLAVAAFTVPCGTQSCDEVIQPGTNQRLDTLGDRLMFRLAYRNFGDHEALVANHSVLLGSKKNQYTGVRWYEIRSPGTAPVVYQQSTYSPDSSFRWMGSIAMDANGNIALGYSVSSATVNPAVRYTGRLASDTASTMQAEISIIEGGGSQTSGLDRWGDYSAMTIDPVDDCTFWYTQEYLQNSGTFNWNTRIASLKFPTCNANKTSQTINFTSSAPAGAAFGGSPYTVTATATSALAVTLTVDATSASVCSLSGSTSGSQVSFIGVGTCTIDANQSGDATYSSAPQVQQSFAVAKAAQTVSFTSTAPANASYHGSSYTVTATSTSGLAVALSVDSSATSVCQLDGATSGSHVSFTGVGTCVIDADQGGNANYKNATQAQQSFTVAPAAQTVAFDSSAPGSASAGGASYQVLASATSGLPVTLTIDATATTVCQLDGSSSGSNVTFLHAGTCRIDANQAGDANYGTAAQAQQSFAVGPGPATVLVFTTQPGDIAQDGTLGTIAVTEQDAFGDAIDDSVSQVDFTVAACAGSIAIGSVTMEHGVATLSVTPRFYTVAAALQVGASSGALTGLSDSFAVTLNGDLDYADGFDGCRL